MPLPPIATGPLARRCLLAFALAAAWPLLPGAAQAASTAAELAELPLETLLDMPVSGTSRFVQRRSQASSAVSVITREEIAAFGYRTLGEALRGMRGVAVVSDRVYDYLGVRGFLASGDYSTRVLLLIDGNRVNDALYDQAVLGGEFPLDLDAVERIEFVPGQGSAVYGANALFGVVNVITREAPRRRQAEATVVWGSRGERALQGAALVPWDGGGLQLRASRRLADGESLFDPALAAAGGDGWVHGTDGERRSAISLRADAGDFTVSLVAAERLKGLPLTMDLIAGDPRNRYGDRYTLLSAEQVLRPSRETQWVLRGFAGRYRFVGDYAMDYPPPTLNRDIAEADWRGIELRATHTGWSDHRLVWGLELRDMPLLWQYNADLDPEPALYIDDRRRARQAALYAEDQWSVAPEWSLHLGGRLDRGTGQDVQFSPRVAAIWTPAPAWAVKLIHSRAFRPPNAFEAHYALDMPAGYLANPELRPERVRGEELVVEWAARHDTRLSVSLYRNRARGLLLLDYDPAIDRYQFANALDLDAQGLEAEAETVTPGGVRLRVNGSAATMSGSGAGSTLFPARTLKGSAIVPLRADWSLGLEAQALSRRGTAGGYALMHVTLNGPLWADGPLLTLTLRNATDRRAVDPGADAERQPTLPVAGRHGRIELRWPLPW